MTTFYEFCLFYWAKKKKWCKAVSAIFIFLLELKDFMRLCGLRIFYHQWTSFQNSINQFANEAGFLNSLESPILTAAKSPKGHKEVVFKCLVEVLKLLMVKSCTTYGRDPVSVGTKNQKKVSPDASYSSQQPSTDFSIHLIQIILRSIYIFIVFACTAALSVVFASEQHSSKAGQGCLFAKYPPDMDPTDRKSVV